MAGQSERFPTNAKLMRATQLELLKDAPLTYDIKTLGKPKSEQLICSLATHQPGPEAEIPRDTVSSHSVRSEKPNTEKREPAVSLFDFMDHRFPGVRDQCRIPFCSQIDCPPRVKMSSASERATQESVKEKLPRDAASIHSARESDNASLSDLQSLCFDYSGDYGDYSDFEDYSLPCKDLVRDKQTVKLETNDAKWPVVCAGCFSPSHDLDSCKTPNLKAFNVTTQHVSWLKAKRTTGGNDFIQIDEDPIRGTRCMLRELLWCVVCYQLPTESKIYSCPNGHVKCLRCCMRARRGRCVSCRVKLTSATLTENKVLTALYPSLVSGHLFECENLYRGCLQDGFPFDKLEEHQRHCSSQIIPCPVFRFRGGIAKPSDYHNGASCKGIVGPRKLIEHLRRHHEGADYDFVMTNRRLKDDWKQHTFKFEVDVQHVYIKPVVCNGFNEHLKDEILAFVFIRSGDKSLDCAKRQKKKLENDSIHISVFVSYGCIPIGHTPFFNLNITPYRDLDDSGSRLFESRSMSGRCPPWVSSDRTIAGHQLDGYWNDTGLRVDGDIKSAMSHFMTFLDGVDELSINLKTLMTMTDIDKRVAIDQSFVEYGKLHFELTINFDTPSKSIKMFYK